jgi:hypothetical protein
MSDPRRAAAHKRAVALQLGLFLTAEAPLKWVLLDPENGQPAGAPCDDLSGIETQLDRLEAAQPQ